MTQTKIYPSTQAQVQAVQSTVDEINSKIVTPTYQVKTVTPSNVQQTVQADTGYTALSGVVVNPIAALMPESLEDYIMRKESMPEFSLYLEGNVPEYACYGQTRLKMVYGNITSIGNYAFYNTPSCEEIDLKNVRTAGSNCFYNSSIKNVNLSNLETHGNQFIDVCRSIQSIIAKSLVSVGSMFMQGVPSLRYLDLRNAESFSSNWFYGQSSAIVEIMDCTSCISPPNLARVNDLKGIKRAVFATDEMKQQVLAATNWASAPSKVYSVAEIEALYGDTYDNLYESWFGVPRFDENEVN